MNVIQTYDQMLEDDMREALEGVILAGGEAFQKRLMEAERIDPSSVDIDGMARLISLINSALVVSKHDEAGFGPWYLERAQMLLGKAADVLTVMNYAGDVPDRSELN